MLDNQLRMTGLLNGDRLANDNRFDMHLSSARKELVGGAPGEPGRDSAADAPRNRRRISADAGVVHSKSSLSATMTGVRRRWSCGRSEPPRRNACLVSRSHASESGNPA
jgi:hypothetical protein